MTKEELLVILRRQASSTDAEAAHGSADDALIAFIGDLEIKDAYEAVPKWYA